NTSLARCPADPSHLSESSVHLTVDLVVGAPAHGIVCTVPEKERPCAARPIPRPCEPRGERREGFRVPLQERLDPATLSLLRRSCRVDVRKQMRSRRRAKLTGPHGEVVARGLPGEMLGQTADPRLDAGQEWSGCR